MAKLQLASPWYNYYHELEAFFKYDRDIHVIFDEENNEVKLYSDNDKKAEALTELLPGIRKFGNVTLKITVVPPNFQSCPVHSSYYQKRHVYRPMSETEELFCNALRNNPVFSFSETVRGILSNDIVYIVFRNEVVQYYNDDLGDYYGQCSTLYQNIAADIFKPIDGVHYCTDKPRYDDRYDI